LNFVRVNAGEYNEWLLSFSYLKLTIESFVYDKVVKTGGWVRNFMKEIYEYIN